MDKEASGKSSTKDSKPKWIITPHLHSSVKQFFAVYKAFSSRRKLPIMIIGPPGVGKSLFVDLYTTLYRESNPKLGHEDIVRLNVAAIPETIIESELFGHVKGAFTGAVNDTPGLVERARLLILEEIGELPKSVQAKLLTFIEDGYYYQVGGRKERRAKGIQIISTTNKEPKDFRPDFFARFFKFAVPALHERRLDVLYYLEERIPGIIARMRCNDVLTLLAYHWPGNMREIDLLIRQAEWQRQYELSLFRRPPKDTKFVNRPPTITISNLNFPHSSISWVKSAVLYGRLDAAKINVKALEEMLNKYGVGLSSDNNRKSFNIRRYLRKLSSEEGEFDQKFDARSLLVENPYDVPQMTGFMEYCGLFARSYEENANLLDVADEISVATVSKKENDARRPPRGYVQYVRIRQQIRSVTCARKETSSTKDVFQMTEKELLEFYLRGMIDRCGGNKAEAARRTGMNDSTFRSRLRKHDI